MVYSYITMRINEKTPRNAWCFKSWCGRRDSNPHGCPLDPKSSASTNFATPAFIQIKKEQSFCVATICPPNFPEGILTLLAIVRTPRPLSFLYGVANISFFGNARPGQPFSCSQPR